MDSRMEDGEDHTEARYILFNTHKMPTSFSEVDSKRKGSTEHGTRTSIEMGLIKDIEETNAIK